MIVKIKRQNNSDSAAYWQRFRYDGPAHVTVSAVLDALKAVAIPTVEVHISDVSAREDFRQISFVRAACLTTIAGHGFAGYREAMEYLKTHI